MASEASKQPVSESVLGGRRDAVVEDTIEMMLARRVKKVSVNIPNVEFSPGKRIRKTYLLEKDMFHLLGQIIGTKYGVPERPDMTLLTVGCGSKKFPDGIQFPYESSKGVYVLSERIEDELITLCRKENDKINLLNQAYVGNGIASNMVYLDSSMQRQWRRFVALHIHPLSRKKSRLKLIKSRFKIFQKLKRREASGKLDKDGNEIKLDITDLSDDDTNTVSKNEADDDAIGFDDDAQDAIEEGDAEDEASDEDEQDQYEEEEVFVDGTTEVDA